MGGFAGEKKNRKRKRERERERETNNQTNKTDKPANRAVNALSACGDENRKETEKNVNAQTRNTRERFLGEGRN